MVRQLSHSLLAGRMSQGARSKDDVVKEARLYSPDNSQSLTKKEAEASLLRANFGAILLRLDRRDDDVPLGIDSL